MTDVRASRRDTLVVIPCLNEEAHLPGLLGAISADVPDALIAVVDGGSCDRTREIAREAADRSQNVVLLDNPARIQSAAVNLAVERMGAGLRWLVRVDAHCGYPPSYVSRVVQIAEELDVASVTVPMRTVGFSCFQRAVAAAQNSKLGTGGSPHRMGGEGRFVEHGHHAAMRLDAFRAAGGYCERMPHNEDAELDLRLAEVGARIWLEPRLAVDYYPRSRVPALFRQYFNYGVGRARTALRHRRQLRARQTVPLAVAPAVLAAAATPLAWWLAIPALGWAACCLGWGAVLALRSRSACEALSGLAAMTMHFGWSTGFWWQIARAEADGETWRASLPFGGAGSGNAGRAADRR